MTASQKLQDMTRQQYQTLHDVIEHAREVCTYPAKASGLRPEAENIQAVLTSLDQVDLQSRTAQFEAVGKQIDAVNADMAALKAEIGHIVENAALANKIVSAIDSAASAAAKLFA